VPAAAVILAGGSGTRVGAASNKVYLPLAGRSVVSWSLRAFADAGLPRLVLVTRPDEMDLARSIVVRDVQIEVDIVAGGTDRHGSEYAALRHLTPEIERGEIDVIAIHDGARPLLSGALIAAVLAAARSDGGAVPGIAVSDLAELRDDRLTERAELATAVRVQTPQAFSAPELLAAYRLAADHGFTGTDTAACMERFGTRPIRAVPGEVRNFKVTYAADLVLAERLLTSVRPA
jgi:2-C-methyl-D-erythritol 4-phosphate cytidylyltransferase